MKFKSLHPIARGRNTNKAEACGHKRSDCWRRQLARKTGEEVCGLLAKRRELALASGEGRTFAEAGGKVCVNNVYVDCSWQGAWEDDKWLRGGVVITVTATRLSRDSSLCNGESE